MRTNLELRRVYSGPSISNPLNGGSSDQPHCYCYKSLVTYGYSGNLWCSYFKSGIACGRHIVVLRYKPILLFLNLVLHEMMDARNTLLLLWLKSFLLNIKDEALTSMIFLW